MADFNVLTTRKLFHIVGLLSYLLTCHKMERAKVFDTWPLKESILKCSTPQEWYEISQGIIFGHAFVYRRFEKIVLFTVASLTSVGLFAQQLSFCSWLPLCFGSWASNQTVITELTTTCTVSVWVSTQPGRHHKFHGHHFTYDAWLNIMRVTLGVTHPLCMNTTPEIGFTSGYISRYDPVISPTISLRGAHAPFHS